MKIFKNLNNRTWVVWIGSWIQLAESIVQILTFALWLPDWTMRFYFYETDVRYRKTERKQNESKNKF